MDSRIGLDYIVENKDYTTKLAAGVYQGVKTIKYLQLKTTILLIADNEFVF